MLKLFYTNEADIPAEYKALYSNQNGRWELTGVAGIKTQDDVDRVQEALRKEREDHSTTKTKLRKFGDRDPEEILADIDKIDEYKLAAEGKMDENKVNELVEARIKSRIAPIERERDQLKADLGERDERITGYEQKERSATIKEAIRTAGTEAKLIDGGLNDALARETMFEINDAGQVVTRDGVGVAPGLSPAQWLKDIQKTTTHWYETSVNAGGQGGGGNFRGEKNPWTKEHWNFTDQSRMVATDRALAEEMATAANSKIGATAPTEPQK